jgi:predicted RNase H-like HicB family nuclease
MLMTRQFTAIIERENEGFVALCPELDVASQGDTIEEARANLREALELFLETASPEEIDQRLRKRGSDPSATGRDTEFRLGRGV